MKNVLVLGGGFAGLSVVHRTLKEVVAKQQDVKVTWVTPNTEHYWNLAAVRAVLPDGPMANEKIFTPIAPGLAQFPQEKIDLVHGKAESLDPDKRIVVVATNQGERKPFTYDILVIATGTTVRDGMPWKNLDTTEATKKELARVQAEVRAAKTVVVAGAGTTGSEITGELAYTYAQHGTKDVYLIVDKDLPLSEIFREDVRRDVVTELEKMKVKIINHTKVTSVRQEADGQKTIELTKSDGTVSTIKAGAYLSAKGVVPNSSFAPAKLLNQNGYIKQNTYLQAEGYDNIFVVGDVGSLQADNAVVAGEQATHAAKSVQARITGASPPEYVPDNSVRAVVALGQSRTTGQLGTTKPWSFVGWYFKGRTLRTEKAKPYVVGKF